MSASAESFHAKTTLLLFVRATHIWCCFFARIPFVVNRAFQRNASGVVATVDKLCVHFHDVTMFTQPYYDLFVYLAKWEANYGIDIFWEPWPKCLLAILYTHVVMMAVAASTVLVREKDYQVFGSLLSTQNFSMITSRVLCQSM